MPFLALPTFIKAAIAIGQAGLAHKDEIIDVLKGAKSLLKGGDDQATAQAAIDDLIEDRKEGFARLDAKLAAAEKR